MNLSRQLTALLSLLLCLFFLSACSMWNTFRENIIRGDPISGSVTTNGSDEGESSGQKKVSPQDSLEETFGIEISTDVKTVGVYLDTRQYMGGFVALGLYEKYCDCLNELREIIPSVAEGASISYYRVDNGGVWKASDKAGDVLEQARHQRVSYLFYENSATLKKQNPDWPFEEVEISKDYGLALANALQCASNEDFSILVTDFDPFDGQSINKVDAIREVFRVLTGQGKEKNHIFGVFALRSRFAGDYRGGNNGAPVVSDSFVYRPFYLIMQGRPDILENIRAQLLMKLNIEGGMAGEDANLLWIDEENSVKLSDFWLFDYFYGLDYHAFRALESREATGIARKGVWIEGNTIPVTGKSSGNVSDEAIFCFKAGNSEENGPYVFSWNVDGQRKKDMTRVIKWWHNPEETQDSKGAFREPEGMPEGGTLEGGLPRQSSFVSSNDRPDVLEKKSREISRDIGRLNLYEFPCVAEEISAAYWSDEKGAFEPVENPSAYFSVDKVYYYDGESDTGEQTDSARLYVFVTFSGKMSETMGESIWRLRWKSMVNLKSDDPPRFWPDWAGWARPPQEDGNPLRTEKLDAYMDELRDHTYAGNQCVLNGTLYLNVRR